MLNLISVLYQCVISFILLSHQVHYHAAVDVFCDGDSARDIRALGLLEVRGPELVTSGLPGFPSARTPDNGPVPRLDHVRLLEGIWRYV